MKIWNDEVNSCSECKYIDTTQYCCNYPTIIGSLIEITDCSIIHPSCLFNQEITKEVFEELGFEFNKTTFDGCVKWYKLKNNPACEINIDGNDMINIYYDEVIQVRYIKLNNPEELKLILNRLEI